MRGATFWSFDWKTFTYFNITQDCVKSYIDKTILGSPGGWGIRDRWGKPRENAMMDPWVTLPKLDTDGERDGSRVVPAIAPSKRISEGSRKLNILWHNRRSGTSKKKFVAGWVLFQNPIIKNTNWFRKAFTFFCCTKRECDKLRERKKERKRERPLDRKR